jgi:hypothetical protein
MKKQITFLILIFVGLNLVAQRVHDFDPVKRGEFNIMDYGATSGGTVEDATAIQIAINAAYALTKAYPDEAYRYGGTVKIPAITILTHSWNIYDLTPFTAVARYFYDLLLTNGSEKWTIRRGNFIVQKNIT